LRIEGGRAVRKVVRLGLRSGGWAELLDGLSEGDRVLPSSASVLTGSRVRAAASSVN
jgi:HlyD family secretion protein